MHTIYTHLFIALATCYVLLLDYFAFSSRGLQKSLVIPILIIIVILYKFSGATWKEFIYTQGKWFVLLWGTIIVQTLIIATGGLQSPFLILLHLFMIGLSFLFAFSTAVFFLMASLITILVDIALTSDITFYFTENPSTTILQIVSFVSIVPFAYIIAQQYHLKALLSKMLMDKINIDEAILSNLDELIILTDENYKILSVNETVLKVLQKPRSVLLNEYLFNTLLLKDEQGELVTDTAVPTASANKKSPYECPGTYRIMNTTLSQNKFTILLQRIPEVNEITKQYCFILRPVMKSSPKENTLIQTIQQARAKYEGLNEKLKQALLNDKSKNYPQLLLMEKIENDVTIAESLQYGSYSKFDTKIDIALLCKQLLASEQPFASSFAVPLQFEIENFSHKDIAPLTVKRYPVKPVQLTGPFFTVPCNTKGTEIVLRKMLELAIFLASSVKFGKVKMQVALKKDTAVLVTVTASSPELKPSELTTLFLPNYGKLAYKTNLHMGSGLEGYLIKSLSTQISKAVKVNETKKSSIIFTWELQKHPEVTS